MVAGDFGLSSWPLASAFVGLQAALVAIARNNPAPQSRTYIVAAILALCASLFIIPASFYKLSRSLKPSTLRSTYLLLTVLFVITQTRTEWLSFSGTTSTKILIASMATKAGLLLLKS